MCSTATTRWSRRPVRAPGTSPANSSDERRVRRVHELSEFLVDVLGRDDVGAYFPHRVTYHPTCHSLRMLGVGDKPQRLLRSVRGLDLVELPEAEACCGFGGTFAVKNAEMSTAMLSDKMRRCSTPARRCCTPSTTRA